VAVCASAGTLSAAASAATATAVVNEVQFRVITFISFRYAIDVHWRLLAQRG
jgi:hypothetical protein